VEIPQLHLRENHAGEIDPRRCEARAEQGAGDAGLDEIGGHCWKSNDLEVQRLIEDAVGCIAGNIGTPAAIFHLLYTVDSLGL
jgi:hypothetical protein